MILTDVRIVFTNGGFMYYIALNVLHNMNISRLKLFRAMNAAFGKGESISEGKVLELGRSLGLTDNIIRYEYDGCRYANFIVQENTIEKLSKRAKTEFQMYDTETKYKLLEIPVTIDIFSKYLDIKTTRVDTVDAFCEEQLLAGKWSRNKSEQRFRKKVHSFENFRYAIQDLVKIFGDRNIVDSNLEKIIETYGRKRNNTKDWSAWINFRGCYASETLCQYDQIYSELFDYTDKAIEWGGNEFTNQQLTEMCGRTTINIDRYVEQAVADGMIRRVAKDRYSITGHAATINKCIKKGFDLYRLNVIIRKKENGQFDLFIGENSQYSQRIKNSIRSDTKDGGNHWFIYEAADLEAVIMKLVGIIHAFDIYDEPPVTGGSVNGSILSAQESMLFSKESY